MEKIASYKRIIEEVIDNLAEKYNINRQGIEFMSVKDMSKGSFLMFSDGWKEDDRFYGCYIHIDLTETGKVLVRHDGTEEVVIDKLIEKGIPTSDIIIGWHAPYERKYTEFAEI